jgi:hypothetical protein
LLDDEAVQREVGFAAEIGYVDAGASPWHEDTVSLMPNRVQQLKIVIQAQILVILFLGIIGR